MSLEDDNQLAAVRFPPAAIVLGAVFIVASSLQVWPLAQSPAIAHVLGQSGLVFMGVGLVILVLAYSQMARAKTTINPSEHSRVVVIAGFYALSRNPIYLGWFVLLIGAGMRRNSGFVMLVAVLMIALLHWAVVLAEERYLESRFGQTYLAYKKRVRRWL